jgi:type IV secretory pathway VirB2 component (pilin)
LARSRNSLAVASRSTAAFVAVGVLVAVVVGAAEVGITPILLLSGNLVAVTTGEVAVIAAIIIIIICK